MDKIVGGNLTINIVQTMTGLSHVPISQSTMGTGLTARTK